MITLQDAEGLWVASIGDFRSLKYGSKEGAIAGLVECLHTVIRKRECDDKKNFAASCSLCDGWGAPAGCRVCGIHSLGG